MTHDMHEHSGEHHDTGKGSQGSHDKHEGHSPEMFRDQLLISVLLTIPILYFSTSMQDWFGG